MQIGYIGLGKMGLAQVERLLECGHRVVAWNRSEEPREKAKKAGAEVSETLKELAAKLKAPRLIWLMVPHAVVGDMLDELAPYLQKGDTVIDGGNSFYKDSMRRASALARRGIRFLDVGVSGGPAGARRGACLMIGGEKKVFKKYEQLFRDLSKNSGLTATKRKGRHSYVPTNVGVSRGGFAYVGKSGAGHFAKMVHNGIEYGMMQALAEGFALLKAADERGFEDTRMNADGNRLSQSPLFRGGKEKGVSGRRFRFNLTQIAELYNHGSVIESRLVGWLVKAFAEHGENLHGISGEVAQSGEGLWTVKTAKEFSVPVAVIKKALEFRIQSKSNPSYAGQVVSALRNQFGGHDVQTRNRRGIRTRN